MAAQKIEEEGGDGAGNDCEVHAGGYSVGQARNVSMSVPWSRGVNCGEMIAPSP